MGDKTELATTIGINIWPSVMCDMLVEQYDSLPLFI